MKGRGSGRRIRIGIAALVLAIALGDARAQTKKPEVIFEDAALFHPATDPSRFVSVYDTRNLDRGRYTLGLYANYGSNPVTLELEASGERSSRVVRGVFGLDLIAALGITDRIQLGLDLPYVHTDTREVLNGATPIQGGGDFLGDIVTEAKFTLIQRPVGQGFGFSLLPRLIFPTGDLERFAGTGKFSYGGLLLADWRYNRINYGVNLGGFIRDEPGQAGGSDQLDDQMQFGVGITVPWLKRVDVMSEFTGRTAFRNGRANPIEGLLSLRYHVGNLAFTFGAGGGVTASRGSPTFRIVAGVTPYVPEKEIPPPRAELVASSRKTWKLAVDVDNDGRPNPGDTLEYNISLVNTGVKAAEEVVFTDPIPEHVSYVPGSMTLNGQLVTDEADADSGDFNVTQPGAVTVKIPNIGNDPASNTASFSFRVVIDPEILDVTTVRNEAIVYHKDQPAMPGTDEETGPRAGERLHVTETTVFPKVRERETVVVTPDKLELTRNIHFEFDKATIRSESYPVLDDVAGVLKENAQLNVLIEGHTDAVGSVQYNQRLSERRAESVKAYLVRRGIKGSRLSTSGKGKLAPIASNDTSVGRAMNRRVEFLIVNPDVLKGKRIEKRPYIEDITPESEPAGISPAIEGGPPTGDRATLEVQQALGSLGYYPGPATGIMDQKTAEAIRKFQQDNSLPVTGEPDATTRKALDEAVELQRSR